MTFDELLRYSLKEDAKEKCTLEIKQRIWLKLVEALHLNQTGSEG
jgi:hypothetical protein